LGGEGKVIYCLILGGHIRKKKGVSAAKREALFKGGGKRKGREKNASRGDKAPFREKVRKKHDRRRGENRSLLHGKNFCSTVRTALQEGV